MVHEVFDNKLEPLPTLSKLFGGHKSLTRAFLDAGVTSVVQLMLLPREALRDIHGITDRSAVHVIDILEQRGLKHRLLTQRMSEFLYEQFNVVEDAPIGALQVITMRSGQISHPVFAPLETLKVLEIADPDMTIVQLMCMSRDGLHAMMMSLIADGILIHDLDEDIRQISSRLGYYDLTFASVPTPLPVGDEEFETDLPQPIRRTLHSVS